MIQLEGVSKQFEGKRKVTGSMMWASRSPAAKWSRSSNPRAPVNGIRRRAAPERPRGVWQGRVLAVPRAALARYDYRGPAGRAQRRFLRSVRPQLARHVDGALQLL